MYKPILNITNLKARIQKIQILYPHVFIIGFLTLTLTQYFLTKKELYPFSPFGMYEKAFSPTNLQEYKLISSEHPSKDQLLHFDHIRFYLKHRIQQIPYSPTEDYKLMLAQELRRCFENEKIEFKLYTFQIKHWNFFEPKKYHQPDQLITIHLKDIFP